MARTIWNLDSAHTAVELSVRHMMFTKVHGRFDEVEGTLEIDEDNPDQSKVSVTIGAASIDTGVEDRDKHLRSADFLDVESHPAITFESTDVEGAMAREGDQFNVMGDLTIRGETRQVTLKAVYAGRGPDPWDHERAGFEATTTIDRRDWGLTWNQTLETGGVLVGNQVAIELAVQAVKQEEAAPEEAHAGG